MELEKPEEFSKINDENHPLIKIDQNRVFSEDNHLEIDLSYGLSQNQRKDEEDYIILKAKLRDEEEKCLILSEGKKRLEKELEEKIESQIKENNKLRLQINKLKGELLKMESSLEDSEKIKNLFQQEILQKNTEISTISSDAKNLMEINDKLMLEKEVILKEYNISLDKIKVIEKNQKDLENAKLVLMLQVDELKQSLTKSENEKLLIFDNLEQCKIELTLQKEELNKTLNEQSILMEENSRIQSQFAKETELNMILSGKITELEEQIVKLEQARDLLNDQINILSIAEQKAKAESEKNSILLTNLLRERSTVNYASQLRNAKVEYKRPENLRSNIIKSEIKPNREEGLYTLKAYNLENEEELKRISDSEPRISSIQNQKNITEVKPFKSPLDDNYPRLDSSKISQILMQNRENEQIDLMKSIDKSSEFQLGEDLERKSRLEYLKVKNNERNAKSREKISNYNKKDFISPTRTNNFK